MLNVDLIIYSDNLVEELNNFYDFDHPIITSQSSSSACMRLLGDILNLNHSYVSNISGVSLP